MILAAAAHAAGKGPPPPELVEGWQAEKWGLPNPGGRLDQPAGYVSRITTALNVYNAVKSRRSAKNWAEWARKNQQQQSIISMVDLIRKEYATKI
jgi:hypothetical protein